MCIFVRNVMLDTKLMKDEKAFWYLATNLLCIFQELISSVDEHAPLFLYLLFHFYSLSQITQGQDLSEA